jgi:hypothetical protein
MIITRNTDEDSKWGLRKCISPHISSLYDTTAVGSGLTNTGPRSTDSRGMPFSVCRSCGLSSVHQLSRMSSPTSEPFFESLAWYATTSCPYTVFGLNLSDFISEVLSKSYLPHPYGGMYNFDPSTGAVGAPGLRSRARCCVTPHT